MGLFLFILSGALNITIRRIKKDIAFAQYFLEWFQTYKKDISDITLSSYQTAYKKILSHFKEIPIQKITKRDYQIFLNELGERNSKDTNRKLNGYIRTCLKEAIDEEIVKNDFTRNVTITGATGKKSTEKFLDYTSSQLLLQDLHKHIDQGIENVMLILALSTGVRFGELVGLSIEDLDFKNNQIKVHRQWKYKKGGGFGPLKTDESERVISVDKLTMRALKQHLKLVENDSENVNKLVFYEPTSDISVVTNDRLNDVLRAILKRLNISLLITVHGLRHTHSSILLYKGMSVLYVSERLGHANIDITTSTYAHVLKELRERDSKQSNDIFEGIIQSQSK